MGAGDCCGRGCCAVAYQTRLAKSPKQLSRSEDAGPDDGACCDGPGEDVCCEDRPRKRLILSVPCVWEISRHY